MEAKSFLALDPTKVDHETGQDKYQDKSDFQQSKHKLDLTVDSDGEYVGEADRNHISAWRMVDPVSGASAATSASAIWFIPTIRPTIRYERHIPTGPVLASVPPLLRNKPVPKTPTRVIIPMCLSFKALCR
ncbi:hypothetical protein OGATHE_003248 [Ogataea polymorpha]|uniref:Uncharacterized protein n=1 Tax=Ogataea polymorpha TaxID=460523 RepID=A0A9P8P9J5_9ASCO|nr:hypothetical protein OGATHE_003248 [Ogataea polymorpha]